MGLLDLKEAMRRSGLIDEFGVTGGVLANRPYQHPVDRSPVPLLKRGGVNMSEYASLERPNPSQVEPGLGSPMLDPTTDFLPIGTMRRLAEMGVAGLKASPLMMGATAYHGSPHLFDKFRLDKIGTGEGAQAYGHGLYFAEKPGVAASYQSGGVQSAQDAISLAGYVPEGLTGKKAALWLRKEFGPSDPSVNLTEADISRVVSNLDNPEFVKAMRELKSLPKNLEYTEKWNEVYNKVFENTKVGNLYKVDIPDEAIGKMLDWDKPLSQQHESVRKALEKIGYKHDAEGSAAFDDALLSALTGDASRALPKMPANPTGADIYRKLASRSGSTWLDPNMPAEAAVSNKLKELGIPGIKYLDQGSRNSGQPYWNVIDKSTGKTVQAVLDKPTNLSSKFKVEGPINPTRNFVVFDENLPKILERK